MVGSTNLEGVHSLRTHFCASAEHLHVTSTIDIWRIHETVVVRCTCREGLREFVDQRESWRESVERCTIEPYLMVVTETGIEDEFP